MNHRTRRTLGRGAVLATAALLLVASACSPPKDPLELGMKRIALDLAFKDPEKAKPPKVEHIIETEQPAPSQAIFVANVTARDLAPADTRIPPPPPPRCPTAPEGALPEQAVAAVASAPPTEGEYRTRNKGTYKLTAAVFNFGGPFPPAGVMYVKNARTEVRQQIENRTGAVRTTPNHYFDVVQIGPGSRVTITYEATPTELHLMQVVTQQGQQVSRFRPTPPITVMYFRGEGASWNSAGIDPDTQTAMVVQGRVEKRETVDLCGKVYDTYRVVSTERVANPLTGYLSETQPDKPNVYNIAPQFGGLFLQQTINTTTNARANNVPYTMELNYTSTLESVTPGPLPDSEKASK